MVGPGTVGVPEGSWAFPRHRVVGEQFSNTSVQPADVYRAKRAWQATLQVQAAVVCQLQPPINVLYSYSDCSLVREAGYVRMSYEWVTTGVANSHLVRAVGPEGGGGWRIDPVQSAWDLETLEQGTWVEVWLMGRKRTTTHSEES